MALLYSGGTGPRELTPILRNTEKGLQTIRRWRGTYAELRDLAVTHGSRNMQLVEESDLWFVLEVTYEGWPDAGDTTTYPDPDSQIVSLYELRGSKASKSIWEIPKVREQMDKIRDYGGPLANLAGLAKFRSDMMALARGDSVVFEAPSDAKHGEQKSARQVVVTLKGMIELVAPIGISEKFMREFFEDLARGVEGRTIDAFVLRRRAVGPVNSNVLPAYLEMNEPLRTSTLRSRLTAVPSGLSRVLPEGYWFAGAPNLNQTDANRLELVQEWQHADEYSTFMFGSAQ